jgi:integrase
MSITVRTSPLKNDRSRLYLDHYHKGKSKCETLDLIIYNKPTTPTEREHNKKARAIAENICAKRFLEAQDQQFDLTTGYKSELSFLDYFKRQTENRKGNEGNYGNWLSTYRYLKLFINGKDLKFKECDEVFLNKFKQYLLTQPISRGGRHLSENSASSYLNKVKAALNEAFNERFISDNPAKRVKGIKVNDNSREYLLIEEVRKLHITSCELPLLKNAFLFSCLTGLRWSDVQKLLWREIVYSEAEGRYKIHYTQKKTKAAEYLPISNEAYQLLGQRKDDDIRVFKGLKYSAWNNLRLAQWVMDAGITKKITFHCARHTYATLLLTNNADLYSVSSLLGHKNIKTTQIYAKIIDSKKNQVVDLLPSISF